MKPPRDTWRGTGFKLESQPTVALFKHQVDLDAGCGAVVTGLPAGIGLQDLFQREAFPRSTENGMAAQLTLGFKAQQRVEQSAIPHIDFRTFHQPLFEVWQERRQGAHHVGLREHVEVVADGGLGYVE